MGAWFTSSNYIGEAFIDKLEKLSPPEAEKAKLEALIKASRDQIALAANPGGGSGEEGCQAQLPIRRLVIWESMACSFTWLNSIGPS